MVVGTDKKYRVETRLELVTFRRHRINADASTDWATTFNTIYFVGKENTPNLLGESGKFDPLPRCRDFVAERLVYRLFYLLLFELNFKA